MANYYSPDYDDDEENYDSVESFDFGIFSQQSLTLQPEEELLSSETPSLDWGEHFNISTSNDNVPPPTQHHIEVLKSRFDISEFDGPQWKIISTILTFLETRELSKLVDQFLIAASGFGKSMCYQFVPVYTNSLALVISPLKSLMKDQVRLMKNKGIPAVVLSPTSIKSAKTLSRLHEFRIVYITPELCLNKGREFIQDLHSKLQFCLVAIDEAHCVSTWGHDFRTKYGKLSLLRNWLPDVPFVALTATASIRVAKDVETSLGLKNTILYKTSINRPNLSYEVYRKINCCADFKTILKTKSSSNMHTFGGPCIVYCNTHYETELVTWVIRYFGIACEFYHAGMKDKDREKVQDKFTRDEIECIVATVAYGMGIGKRDVRMVVHYGAPKELASYMQESGRAGRDDQPSRCIIFYTESDFKFIENIVIQITMKQDKKIIQNRQNMITTVRKFLNSDQCRRKQLLANFDQECDVPSNPCCDNCTRNDVLVFVGSNLKRQSSAKDTGTETKGSSLVKRRKTYN